MREQGCRCVHLPHDCRDVSDGIVGGLTLLNENCVNILIVDDILARTLLKVST